MSLFYVPYAEQCCGGCYKRIKNMLLYRSAVAVPVYGTVIIYRQVGCAVPDLQNYISCHKIYIPTACVYLCCNYNVAHRRLSRRCKNDLGAVIQRENNMQSGTATQYVLYKLRSCICRNGSRSGYVPKQSGRLDNIPVADAVLHNIRYSIIIFFRWRIRNYLYSLICSKSPFRALGVSERYRAVGAWNVRMDSAFQRADKLYKDNRHKRHAVLCSVMCFRGNGRMQNCLGAFFHTRYRRRYRLRRNMRSLSGILIHQQQRTEIYQIFSRQSNQCRSFRTYMLCPAYNFPCRHSCLNNRNKYHRRTLFRINPCIFRTDSHVHYYDF